MLSTKMAKGSSFFFLVGKVGWNGNDGYIKKILKLLWVGIDHKKSMEKIPCTPHRRGGCLVFDSLFQSSILVDGNLIISNWK